MYGFHQRLLFIDLSKQTYHVEPIAEETLEQTLGGRGLGLHLLLTYNPPGVDPISPENNIVFATGPFSGTPFHGSNRYGVFSKSPLTGFFAESYSGGNAAPAMKKTGYDAILLQGASPKPVFLEISPEGVYFHDASAIWGKDTYQTEDTLLALVNVKGAQALVIGPAGENLIPFACIENNYWRSAGRTGMGAVLGSKKVKGVVFHGDSLPPLFNPEGIRQWVGDFVRKYKDAPGVQAYRKYGTTMMVAVMNQAGAFPTGYWESGEAPYWEKISGDTLLQDFEVKPKACPPCLMACGKLAKVQHGPHAGLQVEGPEYETIYAFGGLCGVDDLSEIIYLNDLCDRLGLDTISAGNLLALRLYAERQGILPSSQGSIPLTQRLAQWLQDIAFNRGEGREMSGGTLAYGRKLGLEDQVVHVKGLEPAGYDPRVLKGMALAYATSPRGACHLRTTFYKPELSRLSPPEQMEGKAQMLIDYEDRLSVMDALILCRFYRDMSEWPQLSQMVHLATGLEAGPDYLKTLGARLVNWARSFNLREGMKPEDDQIPSRLFREPLPGGSLEADELKLLLADYYKIRDWK